MCVCKFSFQAIDNVYYCLQFSWGESCISCTTVLLCILHTTVSKIYCKIHTTSDWSPMYSSMTCFCNRNKRDDNDRCTIDCFFSILLSNLVQKVHFLMDYCLLPDDKTKWSLQKKNSFLLVVYNRICAKYISWPTTLFFIDFIIQSNIILSLELQAYCVIVYWNGSNSTDVVT